MGCLGSCWACSWVVAAAAAGVVAVGAAGVAAVVVEETAALVGLAVAVLVAAVLPGVGKMAGSWNERNSFKEKY